MSFRGGTAQAYGRYRRGYLPAVIDGLAAAFGLRNHDTVLDLGCGTGLLTIPLAARVASVVGMDPEPEMLGAARRAATAAGVTNAVWVLGRDSDLPTLRVLLGERELAAVTIADALHWMRAEELFPVLRPWLRPGGGVAVIANGAALWRQETGWSRTLREALEQRFRTTLDTRVEAERRHQYTQALATAGFRDIQEACVEYTEENDLGTLVGTLCSTISPDALPAPGDRAAFAEYIRRALAPQTTFIEHVTVTTLTARADDREDVEDAPTAARDQLRGKQTRGGKQARTAPGRR